MQTGAATVENSMEFPQKTKNGTAFWPGDSTSGNLSEETQNTNSQEHKLFNENWYSYIELNHFKTKIISRNKRESSPNVKTSSH